ncbi:hypothetical protein ACK3TF_005321 [Chlorella vulgaris]
MVLFNLFVPSNNQLKALRALALLQCKRRCCMQAEPACPCMPYAPPWRTPGNKAVRTCRVWRKRSGSLPCQGRQPAESVPDPPDYKDVMNWERRWGSIADHGRGPDAVRAFVFEQPGIELLPEHERDAFTVTLRDRFEALLAAVAAPPDAAAFRARLQGSNRVSEQRSADWKRGWMSPRAPVDLTNLLSPFHTLRVILTYPPRYSTKSVATAKEKPFMASLEHPADHTSWLYSVEGMNTCQFTDLAEHNTGTQPYPCTMGGKHVSLPRRLPVWAEAFADHDVRRQLLAEEPGNLYSMSMYSGQPTVTYWIQPQHRFIDITRPVARAADAVLRLAGHDTHPGEPYGGIAGGRAGLAEYGRDGLDFMSINTHPCADRARAYATGQARQGMLPHGVLQALAGMMSFVVGGSGSLAGRCLPSPERMPTFFGLDSATRGVPTGSWRAVCHSCRFLINVELTAAGEAVEPMAAGEGLAEALELMAEGEEMGGALELDGRGRGAGRGCGADGGGAMRLLSLPRRHHNRVYAACARGSFTTTELEFVRWTGVLPKASRKWLMGLRGDARDAMLRVLMARYS